MTDEERWKIVADVFRAFESYGYKAFTKQADLLDPSPKEKAKRKVRIVWWYGKTPFVYEVDADVATLKADGALGSVVVEIEEGKFE